MGFTDRLIIKMTEWFSGDPKRIQHFAKVHYFSSLIGREECTADELEIVETAAIVHDIGIKPSEEKYGKGNCDGKKQEILGIKPAREMLEELSADENLISRVCFLVGHHHTYDNIQDKALQVLIEADFIVNAFEDNLKKENIMVFRDKYFRTNTGKKILDIMFGL